MENNRQGFNAMLDLMSNTSAGATRHSVGLVMYEILDEVNGKVVDYYYELDGSQVSKATAIDYVIFKKCFHVLHKDDREVAMRIINNG